MALTLGERIRELREAKHLTLDELARLSGIDKSQLSRYEAGSADPTFGRLKRLAAALEVRAGYFFGEIPELEDLTHAHVAARESLRLFLAGRSIPERQKKRYWRATDLPQAPKTVQAWKDYQELMDRILGKKR